MREKVWGTRKQIKKYKLRKEETLSPLKTHKLQDLNYRSLGNRLIAWETVNMGTGCWATLGRTSKCAVKRGSSAFCGWRQWQSETLSGQWAPRRWGPCPLGHGCTSTYAVRPMEGFPKYLWLRGNSNSTWPIQHSFQCHVAIPKQFFVFVGRS